MLLIRSLKDRSTVGIRNKSLRPPGRITLEAWRGSERAVVKVLNIAVGAPVLSQISKRGSWVPFHQPYTPPGRLTRDETIVPPTT